MRSGATETSDDGASVRSVYIALELAEDHRSCVTHGTRREFPDFGAFFGRSKGQEIGPIPAEGRGEQTAGRNESEETRGTPYWQMSNCCWAG